MMTLPNVPAPRFASQFRVRLQDNKGVPAFVPAETVAAADTLIEQLGHETNRRPSSTRISRENLSKGYAYELPGVLKAFVNSNGIDVVCLDQYDSTVSERLTQVCAEQEQLATRPVRFVRDNTVESNPVPDQNALNQVANQLQLLYRLA